MSVMNKCMTWATALKSHQSMYEGGRVVTLGCALDDGALPELPELGPDGSRLHTTALRPGVKNAASW